MTERREWLIRCEFEGDELAVCSVEADRGQVGVFCPDQTHFHLSVEQSREFADALHGATTQAGQDRADFMPEQSTRPSGTP